MASHIKPTSKQEPAGAKHYHILQVVLSVVRVLCVIYAKDIAIKINLCYN